MKVLVDCRGIRVGRSRGIENFAYSIIESVAGFMEEVVVDICRPDLGFYKDYFREYKNISFISDPVQGFFLALDESFMPVKIIVRGIGKFLRQLGYNPFVRRLGWAKKQKADVVYYPCHQEPQHKHIPMVTTIHAILPEYDENDMAVVLGQMQSAAAVITSWPYPFKDLLQRYPFAKDHLFLVPFTAKQNVEALDGYDISRLGVNGQFYLYAAVITPRKNHINLIKAYRCLKRKGLEPPVIICSGGGDPALTKELTRTANSLGVGKKFTFLGYVPKEAMTALYRECKAAISASLWEAGVAAIQEGGMCGKPILCADIKPAREHAKLFNMNVCFFDPYNPEDIAEKIIEFERNINHYKESSAKASSLIRLINKKYMGKCYSDVFGYAAGQAPKPPWAPFLDPKNQGYCSAAGEVGQVGMLAV